MDFKFIVITIASCILIITLIIAYFNLETNNTTFPRALTNCPDYWRINPDNGNCKIPSEDMPNANIGNLKGKPYYLYNNNSFIDLSLNSSATNAIPYTPYEDENYHVYSYSELKIPGYIDLSMNLDQRYVSVSNSINIMKDNDLTKGNEIDFNDNIAWINYDKGYSSICNIKKWVNSKNIVWDGIHNYNKCS
jgi:hypothetical protein